MSQQNTGEVFTIMQAADWLSDNYTEQKMLFGQFWFQGELCILFADTNVGKSILAVQIANSLASGTQVNTFFKNEVPPANVLYIDFEHSTRQFEARYVSAEGKFIFSPSFYRAQFNIEHIPDSTGDSEYLKKEIDSAIARSGAKVLIIDNLTFIQNETGRAKEAVQLMKHLKFLKEKYGLSILALAHTPKRAAARPITQNDLQGSKMLINFCDSAFAIARSKLNPDWRYVKQIKQRSTYEEYGEDNVCVFNIIKAGANLQFEFVCFDAEFNHLRFKVAPTWNEVMKTCIELSNRGYSQRRIALRVGVAASTVNKLLKNAGNPDFDYSCVTIDGVVNDEDDEDDEEYEDDGNNANDKC